MPIISDIDKIINELTTKDNNLIIFCGAGISINSGLPAAIPLLKEILKNLEIDPQDLDKLINTNLLLAMPFEMFIEIFLDDTDEHQILNIFRSGAPSTNHFFIHKCFQSGILNEIYTTNFDLLIEKSFHNRKELQVFDDEISFNQIDESTAKCKLIKIHGCIDNFKSIRTTLSTITRKSLVLERDKVIDRLFRDGSKNILIIGYSCSDIFDIIPKIEKVHSPKCKIYYINHDKNFTSKDVLEIEDVNLKKENNPFKNYKGTRITVNTDSFIQWLWDGIDSDYEFISEKNVIWKNHIIEWIGSFHSNYLKYSILGKIFYQISEYDLALKYHEKALKSSSINTRGYGAAYSNMGLIFHSQKNYLDAIVNYAIAKDIFTNLNFYFGIAAAYTNLGYSYIYLDENLLSLKNLKKSLQISRKNDFKENKKCESDSLSNLGLLFKKMGKHQDSLSFYEQTLYIDKEEGNKAGEAQTLSDIADVYREMGELKKSINMYSRAQNIAERTGMQELTSHTKTQILHLKSLLV